MSHVIVQTYTKIYLSYIWSSNVKIVLHFISLYLTVSGGGDLGHEPAWELSS